VIQKGQRPEHVLAAVTAAKAVGMMTTVNFMFGFPEEGVDELDRTLDFMQQLAPHTDSFNHRGVLVPFPGTAIYDRWHEEFEFSEWWLDATKLADEADLPSLDDAAMQACLETDPTLALDFFRYSNRVRDKIAECVRFKARHNQAKIKQQQAANVTAMSH